MRFLLRRRRTGNPKTNIRVSHHAPEDRLDFEMTRVLKDANVKNNIISVIFERAAVYTQTAVDHNRRVTNDRRDTNDRKMQSDLVVQALPD
jgi:hypothetical protein